MDETEYTFDDAYVSLTRDPGSFQGTTDVEEIMKKSVIGPGFATLKKLPDNIRTKKRNKKPVKSELPDEVKKDLQVLNMRSALDPKTFYKRRASKRIKGQNIQVGTVLDSPADFYHSRLPKKARKPTLVDQLLADAKFKRDIKRRFVNIILEDNNRFKRVKKKHRVLRKKLNEKAS